MDAPDVEAIVIIDDEMSFTDMLGRLLGDYFSCPIITFSNPLTALEAIPLLKVGMVVTDYYMPHLNGLELIRRIGELRPCSPPCLLITGHTLEDESIVDQLACLKGILAKPFRWQQLAAQIKKHWPEGLPSPVRADAVPLL